MGFSRKAAGFLNTWICWGARCVHGVASQTKILSLCLDLHQVLDRSRIQSAWTAQRVPKENLEFLKRFKNLFGNHLVIAIVLHIENSAKNEAGLIEACNRTEGLNHLMSFVIVTRTRDEPIGKLKAIEAKAMIQRKSSALIVDDNILVIDEYCRFIHMIHLHLRRKPFFFREKFYIHLRGQSGTIFGRLWGSYCGRSPQIGA